MPGIFGIIGKTSPNVIEEKLRLMVDSMMQEPFYTSGIITFEKLKLGVGWVNHEGSFADCMPVWNEIRNICLIFSGENFMEFEDIAGLKAQGHNCNLETASYLVYLYEDMGLKFIEKLNGWFCGLVVDLRLGKAFLFNDRYGMHRVFVHENKDGFYFASEAKALLAVVPDSREFDPKGVGELLTCGCTLGNRSLYKEISILPGATLWEFENGEIKTHGSYFDIRKWTGQRQLEEEQFSCELIEKFGKIVRRYAEGPLPVGISLTGGLDSRMILAALDQASGTYPCYTFGSMFRDTFDVQTAREVAKACGQPHHTLVLGDKFLSDFPRYLEKAVYISDGYLGMSGAAELYMNSVARNFGDIRLTGNYGGELLRGDRAFKCVFPKDGFISPVLTPFLQEAQSTFQGLENADAVTFAVFRQAPSQGYGTLSIERSQLVLRSPFLDNDLVRLVYQAPRRLLLSVKTSLDVVARYKPGLMKIPTDRGILYDNKQFKNSMRKFKRKIFIKGEYWSSHGIPNWLSVISGYGARGLLEKTFLGRDKFQHFHLWTQKNFSDYITSELLRGIKELDDFFSCRRANEMVHEHMAGRRNYLNEIDKLLTLILAKRTLVGRGKVNGVPSRGLYTDTAGKNAS
jgi:asparagine synthase (glutamine-hydrolysing)